MTNVQELTMQASVQTNGSAQSPVAPAQDAIADLQAMIENKVAAAYQEAQSQPKSQIAEPYPWWDLYAVGPIQFGASVTPPAGFGGPLLPNQILRIGEQGVVFTILVLNPSFPAPSAATLISNFALPYRVQYNTGDLSSWTLGPANLQAISGGNFIPNLPFAVNAFPFTAQNEGLFEMNISARILGANNNPAPPFAGYATAIRDIDSSLFLNQGPRWQFDQPIRFQVYA